jgi:hypothetical protein
MNKNTLTELVRKISECMIAKDHPELSAEDRILVIDGGLEAQLDLLERRYGVEVLPNNSESCVVALESPKTAAMFFDRVWQDPNNAAFPEGIGFYGASEIEIWMTSLVRLIKDGRYDVTSILTPSPLDRAYRSSHAVSSEHIPSRGLAMGFMEKHKIPVLPMYSSTARSMTEYRLGDRRAIVAAIENMQVIDERKLSWDQIVEIRSDVESLGKIRRLRHWLEPVMNFEPA